MENIEDNCIVCSCESNLSQLTVDAQQVPDTSNNVLNTYNNNLVDIQNKQNIICCKNDVYQFSDVNALHIGNNIYVGNGNTSSKKTNFYKKTTTIEKMMQSKETVSTTMLDVISTHLGKEFKDVMRKLGLTDGQIEQAIMDFYVNGIKEVIYQLLCEWTRQNVEHATLGKITKVLWKCDQKECVNKMKNSYKCS